MVDTSRHTDAKKLIVYQLIVALIPVVVLIPGIIWWGSSTITEHNVKLINIERRVGMLESQQATIVEIQKNIATILAKQNNIAESITEIKEYVYKNNRRK